MKPFQNKIKEIEKEIKELKILPDDSFDERVKKIDKMKIPQSNLKLLKDLQKQFQDEIESSREKLADLEHQQWSYWTKYMLVNLTEENFKRWTTQIQTPYLLLTEKEKDADRIWADKVIRELLKSVGEMK